jgi:hypothetical protein
MLMRRVSTTSNGVALSSPTRRSNDAKDIGARVKRRRISKANVNAAMQQRVSAAAMRTNDTLSPALVDDAAAKAGTNPMPPTSRAENARAKFGLRRDFTAQQYG